MVIWNGIHILPLEIIQLLLNLTIVRLMILDFRFMEALVIIYIVLRDDDSGVSSYSSDTFDVEAGNTYYIAWDDGQSSWEDFEFTLTEFEIPDNCTWTLNMYDSYGDGWVDFWGNSLMCRFG